ncbi:helix-turn-helix domain-containing protein [Allofournierella sp.]|uniref:helix-turn-helix domain-containing protein n=1 Tax=Allofournierella sp. TaxID=1940256 RepID=UPI003AB3C53A
MSTNVRISVDNEIWHLDQDVVFRLVKCGRERCLAGKKEESGQRIYFSLHYVLRGEGYLSVGGETIRIGKGSIFLIRPSEDITYYPDKNDPWEFLWADFIGENLGAVFASCGLGENQHYVRSKAAMVSDYFKKMVDAHFERGELFESTLFLVQILFLLAKENASRPQKSINKIVREAIIFINDNYSIGISLDIVAKSVGTSPNHLVNAFTAEVGLSPMKYLTMFRIANACDLLRKNKHSVKEVSSLVGYRDPLYFSRCFSELKGVPPRDYSKRCPQDDPWEFIKKSNIDLDDRKGNYLSK